MNREKWVDIKGFEGLYKVSNMGRIMSHHGRCPRILIPKRTSTGYLNITLCKNGISYYYKVHRLVALHFIPNPHGYLEVNHRNEIKSDNRVENLEWCTRSYNVNFGDRIAKQKAKVSHPVYQVDSDGYTVGFYNSIADAVRKTKIFHSSIRACCNQKRKTAGGYSWKYATSEVNSV